MNSWKSENYITILSNDTIYRIPFQNKNGYCPICWARIYSRGGADCFVHSSSGRLVKKGLSLPVCDECNSFSSDGIKAFNPDEGLYLELFRVKDSDRFYFRKIYGMEYKKQEKGLAARDFSLCIQNGYPETDEPEANYVVELPEYEQKCPICNSKLNDQGNVILPVNDTNSLIVKGRICRQCDTVYVSNPTLISNLINSAGQVLVHLAYKSHHIRFYILYEDLGMFLKRSHKGNNDRKQWNAVMKNIYEIAARAEEINGQNEYLETIKNMIKRGGSLHKLVRSRVVYPLNKYDKWQNEKGGFRRPSKRISHTSNNFDAQLRNTSILVTVTVFRNNIEELYFITGDRAIADNGKNIYHYTSAVARELLTACFRPEREKRGKIEGITFTVIHVYTADNDKMDSIITEKVYIKRDGGYRTSYANNDRREAMGLLLYSRVTDCYEILQATYDKESGYIFVDMQLVTDFVRKYGNPGISFYVLSNRRGDAFGMFDSLNDTSELMELGYTVRADIGLSKAEREELLSFIIDLRILNVTKIVALLDFFISSHPGERYDDARMKWLSDKRFVKTYKFNPSRFIISNNIIR